MGLLAFIRTAHHWTVLHPDIAMEDDVRELLAQNQELARLLLDDPEVARCDMSTRLFQELEGLRDLHERRELEQTKRELEAQVQLKEMLLRKVNHRVKNSLQLVSSILRLQMPLAERAGAGDVMRSASARVMAIAAVHERLYTGDDVRTVALIVATKALRCDRTDPLSILTVSQSKSNPLRYRPIWPYRSRWWSMNLLPTRSSTLDHPAE